MEAQGTSLKDDGRLHGKALGEAAYSLLGDRMQGGQGDVLLADALVEERLDIGLGIDAAPAGDIVELGPVLSEGLVLFGRHFQKGGDLIDKGSRPARTAAVHAHIRDFEPACRSVLTEKNDLGILTAQLDRSPGLGIILHDCKRIRHDLLHKGDTGRIREGLRTRAGKSDHHFTSRGNRVFSLLQERADTFLKLRVMTDISAENDLFIPAAENDSFCSCRTDIHADPVFHRITHFSPMHLMHRTVLILYDPVSYGCYGYTAGLICIIRRKYLFILDE